MPCLNIIVMYGVLVFLQPDFNIVQGNVGSVQSREYAVKLEHSQIKFYSLKHFTISVQLVLKLDNSFV